MNYQEILEKVMPLAGRDPGRFKRFYDRVTELLLRIPEGDPSLYPALHSPLFGTIHGCGRNVYHRGAVPQEH